MTTKIPDFPLPIVTPRLTIRPPQMGDSVEMYPAVLESFKELNAFMDWAKEQPTLEQTEEFVKLGVANWIAKKSEEPWLPLFIFDKDTNEFIGATGYHNYLWDLPSIRTGYWIRTSRYHQGLATEAVNALTQYAIMHLGVKRITITCEAANIRSLKVAERLGYHLEATLKNNRTNIISGKLADTLIYTRYDLIGLPDLLVEWGQRADA
jgi:ribosomal-protein-serine acetyltransferase